MRRLPVLLLLAACSEYDINPDLKDRQGAEDTSVDCPPGEPECGDTDTSVPPDSGDSAVPTDCSVTLEPAGTVAIQEECVGEATTVTDPWNVREEWHYAGLSTNRSVHNGIAAPVSGNLNDDNGDGMVDENDIPEVVAVMSPSSNFTSSALVVLDGVTGAEVWVTPQTYNSVGGPALADVDADGFTDIIAFNASNQVVALEGDGTVKWTSRQTTSVGYPQAIVADLDADGMPEVIGDQLILNGEDGSLVANIAGAAGLPYRIPAAGDIDLDGEQEVIIGNQVVGPTGTVEWSSTMNGSYGHWSAILDTDGDPYAEIIMIANGQLALYEHDGTQIWRVSAGTPQPGPPCVADFDGDGAAEIGWASSDSFNLYEVDGTRVWSARIDDSSGLAACAGYDFDGDGTYEVLFADQTAVFIFDGRTGAVNYSNPNHASGTAWEFPTVADVDNDGSAEIVYVSNDYWHTGWNGVTVLGHNGDGWKKSGTTWNVHDFAVTNINPDGSVPVVPDPPWQVHNVYRARPSVDLPPGAD
ncbi:MAG: FG-GAP repeat domain-containing protein, partial [Myxococcota bacterium]